MLIPTVLFVLAFGFLLFIFTVTFFDTDPKINLIARAFYFLVELRPWYYFDIVFSLVTLIVLIFLYFKNKWRLKETITLALAIIIFSTILNVGFYVRCSKQVKIVAQQCNIQQQFVSDIYTIKILKAEFVDLNSSNSRYIGNIYLNSRIASVYEYSIEIYANKIKAKVI